MLCEIHELWAGCAGRLIGGPAAIEPRLHDLQVPAADAACGNEPAEQVHHLGASACQQRCLVAACATVQQRTQATRSTPGSSLSTLSALVNRPNCLCTVRPLAYLKQHTGSISAKSSWASQAAALCT